MPNQPRHSFAALTAKFAFTALCLLSGVLAVSDPGWSAMLKAQGYYADLSLNLLLPSRGVSGTDTALSAEVANNGPDRVTHYRIWFASDVGLQIVDPGCSADAGGILCLVNKSLDVGERKITPVQARLSQFASGALALAGVVESDLIDTRPANDLDARAIAVTLMNNVSVIGDFLPGQPLDADGRVRFRVRNMGPGHAPDVRTDVSMNGRVPEYTCEQAVLAQCGPHGSASLLTGGDLVLAVVVPRADLDLYGGVSIEVVVHSATGINQGYSTRATVYVSASLFASGFE